MTNWQRNSVAVLATLVALVTAFSVFPRGSAVMYAVAYEDQVQLTIAESIDEVVRYQIKQSVAVEVERLLREANAGLVCLKISDTNVIAGENP